MPNGPQSSWNKALYDVQRWTSYTPFRELVTTEFTPQIELSPGNPLSTRLRDAVTTNGSGTVSKSGSEVLMSTGATANSKLILESKERGRYQPGIQAIGGIGLRVPTRPSNDQYWRAGLFDDDTGFGFGEDAEGLYTFVRSGGTDTKTRQSKWNRNRLDGTLVKNESEADLDLKDGAVLRFPFTMYGYGDLENWALVGTPLFDGKRMTFEAHYDNPDGLVLSKFNLPIRVEVDNGAQGGDFDVRVGGRHFAVYGRYRPNNRVTCHLNGGVSPIGTTLVPLVSFRKKSGFEQVSARMEGASVLVSDDMHVELFYNGTLTGPSSGLTWGAPEFVDADETAFEVNTNAESISDPHCLYGFLASGGKGGSFEQGQVQNIGFSIPDQGIITLAVRTITASNATASGLLQIAEEW